MLHCNDLLIDGLGGVLQPLQLCVKLLTGQNSTMQWTSTASCLAHATLIDTTPSGGTSVQLRPCEASSGSSQQSSAVAGGALGDDNESCVCMSATYADHTWHTLANPCCCTYRASVGRRLASQA